MTSAVDPLDQANRAQRRAADPRASVWVAASAGSGKTKVLTDRVLSLLLHGSPADKILCLTFTKAAAAEMANRLAKRLSKWAVADEDELIEELLDLLGERPDEPTVARARRLFALVLDAPGGIKIQTLHAFCQSLLGRFPLEAGIAPQVKVLDEREAEALLEAARVEVLAGQRGTADGSLAADIATVVAQAHELTFAELLSELIRERARLKRLVAGPGGLAAAADRMFRRLEVAPDDDPAAIQRSACTADAFDARGLTAVGRALATGTAKEREKAPLLLAWLQADATQRHRLLAGYRSLFLTKTGEPRQRLLTKAAMAAEPQAAEAAAGEAARLEALSARLNALTVARANAALLRIGAAILARYQARKRAAALLDYDDLILTARDLLQRADAAAWVLYKLDRGIDHILIDEGQDTNPEQWHVVQALADEFFAGEGAAEVSRTLFVVGDAKQSIFSFQRADPRAFEAMRRYFSVRVQAAEQRWREVPLNVSFRSTAAVLSAVDRVFALPEVRAGVVFGEARVEHVPTRAEQPGLVELWPTVAAAHRAQTEPWALPLELAPEAPAYARLARGLARKIRYWTLDPAGTADPDCLLASKGRRIRPGDVMVLVRRRNEFVEAFVRHLKALSVPVIGVDRMVLTDQLAVMDLIALGRIALLPQDDLTLATVLKGPLVGLDEDQLFQLAYGRRGSLWNALAEAAGRAAAPEGLCQAWAFLSRVLARADFVPPYEFYAELLTDGGRQRILARLGPEAGDALDEFLSLALAYGRESVASLEGFLHWLEGGRQEVKRDMELGADAVRIMTVHGAKGLQAPIVILPDTLQPPQSKRGLLWLSEEDGSFPLWPVRRDLDGPLAADAREQARRLQDAEYRRLLYVAMTRAEDRLYVTGWEGRRDSPAGCWYELVQQALLREPADGVEALSFDFSDLGAGAWAGRGLRLASAPAVLPEIEAATAEAAPQVPPLPVWSGRPAPPEPEPPRPLMPSRPAEQEPAVQSPLGEAGDLAYRRGRLIHRLLEVLPQIPADRRPAAAHHLMRDTELPGGEAARAALLFEVTAILEAPGFADLFGPESRAEVPLMGVIETARGSQVISGQVDRLVLRDGEVLVVDYKSNRPPPEAEGDVPALYLRQLAAYRAVLARIYPDRSVSCALLWTAEPRLMQISDAALAEHAP